MGETQIKDKGDNMKKKIAILFSKRKKIQLHHSKSKVFCYRSFQAEAGNVWSNSLRGGLIYTHIYIIHSLGSSFFFLLFLFFPFVGDRSTTELTEQLSHVV